MRRHDLAYLKPRGWHNLLAPRVDLAAKAAMRQWADRGWPLVARRSMPGEGPGVALGLPLPPHAGKHRFALLVPSDDIATIAPPPRLDATAHLAPLAWRPSLARIGAIAAQHDVGLRVYGSLAFQYLTGLAYLTDQSDLDLLVEVRRGTDLRALAASLAAADAAAPMRIDGELTGSSGAAVKWREVLASSGPVLVRTDTSLFLAGVDRLFGPEAAA